MSALGHRTALLIVATLVLGACAPSFAEATGASLRGALDAAGASRDLAVDASKRAQERIVDEMDAEIAAVPMNVPDRVQLIEAARAKAKAGVVQVRHDRDRVLESCARAYRAIAMADAILPLIDMQPARKAQALALVSEALAALDGMK